MRSLGVAAILASVLPLVLPSVATAEERTVSLVIERMTCALCPITVTKAIEGVDGVMEVIVDYQTKQATVRYDDTKASEDKITSASANAGYPARKVQ